MLLLKLALIPASILLASLAARRFGHNVGGVVSGLPLIAAPIVGVLLFDQPADTVARITRATLATVPATFVFIAAYAWLATRSLRWWGCLAGAALAFVASGLALSHAHWPVPVHELVSIACPFVALRLMPVAPAAAGGVRVPRSEIVLRMACALSVGAVILLGAGRVPPAVSGLLLTWPITGAILPSFTLPLYGRDATVLLLRGFVTGLIGFVVFFNVLPVLLEAGLHAAAAFAAALAAAAAAGWSLHRFRRRRDAPPPVGAAR